MNSNCSLKKLAIIWIFFGEECFALLGYLFPFLLGEPLVAPMYLSHFPKTFIASELPKLFCSKGLTQLGGEMFLFG